MGALTGRINGAVDKMDKYPETADDYVEYLMFLDDIQEQVHPTTFLLQINSGYLLWIITWGNLYYVRWTILKKTLTIVLRWLI